LTITDASNKERDQINAIAQDRREAAGELGSGGFPLDLTRFQLSGNEKPDNGVT
jgi:hypothetical protein